MTETELFITLVSAIATPLGLIVVAIINWRASTEAMRASFKADQSAQMAAHAARASAVKLDDISIVAQKTHGIVNSQNTKLLQVIASLTARVSRENPQDVSAYIAAADAASAVAGKLDSDAEAHSPEKP